MLRSASCCSVGGRTTRLHAHATVKCTVGGRHGRREQVRSAGEPCQGRPKTRARKNTVLTPATLYFNIIQLFNTRAYTCNCMVCVRTGPARLRSLDERKGTMYSRFLLQLYICSETLHTRRPSVRAPVVPLGRVHSILWFFMIVLILMFFSLSLRATSASKLFTRSGSTTGCSSG